jgi:YVTN family beta-propeller protein
VKTGKVPDWITFTPDGKLIYVANSGANSVSTIDTVARKQVARIPVGEVPQAEWHGGSAVIAPSNMWGGL